MFAKLKNWLVHLWDLATKHRIHETCDVCGEAKRADHDLFCDDCNDIVRNY